jgi:hypothetical protein
MRFRPGHAWPARAALIAVVPATALAAAALPGVHLFADADRSTAVLDTLVVAALLAVAVTIGPRALDASRGWALVVVLAATGTLLVGGIAWSLVSFLSLCSHSTGTTLATLATAAAIYVFGSVYAFRDTHRTVWAWPLAIVLALAASLLVLALIMGGTHTCAT